MSIEKEDKLRECISDILYFNFADDPDDYYIDDVVDQIMARIDVHTHLQKRRIITNIIYLFISFEILLLIISIVV